MAKSKVEIKKHPKKAISRLEKIAKELNSGDDSVKAGLPRGSNNYPDGTSVIMVGAVHEFGSPSRGVPERSYLRSTIEGNRSKYADTMKGIGARIAKGEISKSEGLQLLGLILQTDIKDKIIDLKSPSLTYRDGNPLVDTGHLVESITFQVGDGDAD